ncbi:ABC transporter substrate-binding protein [Pseudarthrobacter sp. SSS035]|uniref:ABC transporter substrate-binding protein n=1 Tax=Pseudarthrobacter sp. SSS035 TaxID=2931399 RepID=UPI00200EAD02|nr:ABC transporter substrate-binding protein [Pseudarthrobacter sp. SSS035]
MASGGSLSKVTVGLLPITDVAPVYLGIQEGFFETERFELEVQLALGAAAIVSGQYQFGYSSLLVAHQNEIPIQVTSNGSSSTNIATEDTTEVAALANSDISSVADLAGKTVAGRTAAALPSCEAEWRTTLQPSPHPL